MAVQAKVGQQDQGQGNGNGSGKGHASRFSIDLSLELERELNSMESPPPVTPLSLPASGGAQPHRVTPGGGWPLVQRMQMTSRPSSDSAAGDAAVDPQVLTHLVGELKKSLEAMTKERDDLVQLLTTANEERASDKDALSLMEEKALKAEEELVAARKQIKDDEEQIGLLRAKVEESRYVPNFCYFLS